MADWSELPSELLDFISTLTNTNTSSDIRRFRSVCSSWRSSVTVKPQTPHFLPPNIKSLTSHHQNKHLDIRLVKQTTFLLSLSSNPTYSWVIKAEEHKPGVLTLTSPLSNKKGVVINHFDYNILDLKNVDVFEVSHEYVLRNVSGSDHMNLYDDINMEHEKLAFGFVGDFVANNDNFTLLSTHNSTGKLLMYRSNVQEWTFLDDFALGYEDRGDFVCDSSMRYVDVVSYEGRFYAVTDSGRTVVIRYGEDMSPVVELMVKSIIGGDKKCLVKSGDDLLLVDLYTCREEGLVEVITIDVFMLDKDTEKWVLLKSLGGRSIFLSNYSSFSVTSVHGVKEDCIYISLKSLASDLCEKNDGNLDGNGDFYDEDGVENSEIGVFEYERGYFGSLEENYENSKVLCWPPPPVLLGSIL